MPLHTGSGELNSTILQQNTQPGDNTGAAQIVVLLSLNRRVLFQKKLLECFVLLRFKQLRQGKLHNPFSKFQTFMY